MKTVFIFDIDGTICYARQRMEESFAHSFLEFSKQNTTVLVTGSDRSLAEEQVPRSILDQVQLYCCAGADGISFKVDTSIPSEVVDELGAILKKSSYPVRTGNHINYRTGMINFSIVGRNANREQRQQYINFDLASKERETIVNSLSQKYPNLTFLVGGEISIDISKKGIDKSLVAQDLKIKYPDCFLIFVANNIIRGNDAPLAEYIHKNNLGYSVQIEYPVVKTLSWFK